MTRICAALAAALVTLLGLALLGSLPATAETPSPTPSPTPTADPWTYISYEGELQSTDYSRDGQTSTHDPIPLTVTIRCADDSCVLSGIGFGDSAEHAITGASGSWTTEAIGSICGDAFYAAAGTMTAEATADEITITQHLGPSATEFCPSESYQWGSDRTFVGAFAGGDPCVLEGAPCPPEPTAEPSRRHRREDPTRPDPSTSRASSAPCRRLRRLSLRRRSSWPWR
ncbi:hypothetical protein [Antiquaquibacter soli]|uniref:Uncharacterized protein n=1 Tax=Antiquaquibacter soli TaxID=3064523 RepID=A0ABT9BS56_9MICO|nr:hypothetical protein [Protaetiibacter sp. WY-16]MDO7882177.1 hypothetical protein [Protaetiibacter sp. WY-16]